MYLAEILNTRTEFEKITHDFNLPSNQSDINSINWFLENGHRSNSLRNGYSKAIELATIIKEYADGCTKETGTSKQVRTF